MMGRPPFNGTTAMTAAERQRKHRASIEARLEARLAAIEADLASVRERLAAPRPGRAARAGAAQRRPLHAAA